LTRFSIGILIYVLAGAELESQVSLFGGTISVENPEVLKILVLVLFGYSIYRFFVSHKLRLWRSWLEQIKDTASRDSGLYRELVLNWCDDRNRTRKGNDATPLSIQKLGLHWNVSLPVEINRHEAPNDKDWLPGDISKPSSLWYFVKSDFISGAFLDFISPALLALFSILAIAIRWLGLYTPTDTALLLDFLSFSSISF